MKFGTVLPPWLGLLRWGHGGWGWAGALHRVPLRRPRRSPSGSWFRRDRCRRAEPRSRRSWPQAKAVGCEVGDHEEGSADDDQPVVPVAPAALLVDRHRQASTGAAPCRTPISSWLSGSSLTPTPTRVAFSPSAGDSRVSTVIPLLRSVVTFKPARSQTAASSLIL